MRPDLQGMRRGEMYEMPEAEQTRIAGLIADFLRLMGCDREEIAAIGNLVHKHAEVMEKYEVPIRVETVTRN